MLRSILVFCSLSMLLYSAEQKGSYQFAILGDRTGGCDSSVFAGFVSQVIRLCPQAGFCAQVGDQIEGYSTDTSVLGKQYREFRNQLKPLLAKIPYHACVGNHDLTYCVVRDWYVKTYGPRYYSFDCGPDHFLMLDNSEGDGKAFLRDTAQMNFIQSDLHQAAGKRFRIVFYHKPVWEKDPGESAMAPLHSLWDSLKVDYVFNGHYHSYSASKLGRIQYVTVGSSGGGAENLFGTASFYHALQINVSPAGLQWKFILLDGQMCESDLKWTHQSQYALLDSLSLCSVTADTVLASSYSGKPQIPFVLHLSNPTNAPLLFTIKKQKHDVMVYDYVTFFEKESLVLKPHEKRSLTAMLSPRIERFAPSVLVNVASVDKQKKLLVSKSVQLFFRRSISNYPASDSLNDWNALFAKTSSQSMNHSIPSFDKTFDTAWVGFSYTPTQLRMHYKCYTPFPDSLRLKAKERDAVMAEGMDHLRFYLAAKGMTGSPIFCFFVTPDGVLRDSKTVCNEDGGAIVDSVTWNGGVVIFHKIVSDGYIGAVAVNWKDIGLAGPSDIVFNARCGSAYLKPKKVCGNAYQEPFEKDPKNFAPVILVR